MFAKVENNQVVLVNSDISVFGRKASSWSSADRIANGVYEVEYDTSNLRDQEFYYNGNESFTFANGKVTASYGVAVAKALEDRNEVDRDGQPLLDRDGKQVVTKGLKSNHVARIKSQAAGLLQSTDWYVIRNAESQTAIPANVSTYRAAVRSKSNDMEALINAVSSVEQLAALYVYDKDTKSRPLGDFPRL
jgi:hypothetical protein